ncbi:MAG TPA: 50S ribosomal protein L6 [Candidatus Marinimicrobia bacterium]|jgi:large subunit ribosomal protein L6|nr:50S ribosomal protein L6 [Candidatus Neomarinimicrobiota bacterium]MDP6275443.1 50S ribosomal protein L6 [Candidatus Neomarinimicrobiota bacterium]MDP7217092.1 50S ribosomal protein L6 [Candidatus Neomarinimicrobiota bacterium]HBN45796.1 50S ribosomal protein L6 [Candidatus Neomarinimicrobiota bacterium]HJL75195.1 50S ribosomal protein L6 [Candidatus Neomarinimicrobiota bacterium]|tara:strand:- start:8426 stop:8968 length:543 start_codon:yes stop_codon:yes gene_type:complete
MSRIGKEPINIPEGVTVDLQPNLVTIKGQKGELRVNVHEDMNVEQVENQINVSRPTDNKSHRALHGTTRALIANAILGVAQGFVKELEIIGIGFQANMQGNRLVLQLGFSHDIHFDPPEGIEIKAKRTEINVSGIDKQLVGAVAAKIRSFRKPEPYKGKGIRYKGEYVRSKQGKTVATGV